MEYSNDTSQKIQFIIKSNKEALSYFVNRSSYIILIILSGQTRCTINGEFFILEGGNAYLIRPDDTLFFSEPKASINYIIMNFSPNLCSQLFILFEFDSEMLSSRLPYMTHSPEYENLQHKIINYSQSELKMLTVTILSRMVTAHKDIEPANWIKKLVYDMNKKENFSKGVQQMYSLCHYSKEHICREIHRAYGETPSRLINNIRLDYIAKMLVCTDDSVIDIVYEAGYENLSHFYHLFKQRFGVSPAKYRLQNSSLLHSDRLDE